MKDWKAIARASGIAIPAGDLERIAPPLDALETVLRPLLSELPPGLEPAVEFHPGGDDE